MTTNWGVLMEHAKELHNYKSKALGKLRSDATARQV